MPDWCVIYDSFNMTDYLDHSLWLNLHLIFDATLSSWFYNSMFYIKSCHFSFAVFSQVLRKSFHAVSCHLHCFHLVHIPIRLFPAWLVLPISIYTDWGSITRSGLSLSVYFVHQSMGDSLAGTLSLHLSHFLLGWDVFFFLIFLAFFHIYSG